MTWLAVAASLVVVSVGIAACFFRFDRDPGPLEARYATGPSRFIEAGGIRFHVRDRGQGPVLVLLHGQSANFTVWEDAAMRLARDRRVVSVDLPGHGLTGPDPLERYSIESLAQSLEALLVVLGVGRFALAGNSLGGGVAEEYALAHPDKLSALLLLDPVGARVLGPAPTAFASQTIPVFGPFVHWFTPPWLVGPVLATTYGDTKRMTREAVGGIYDLLLRAGNRDAQHKTLLGAVHTTLPDRISGIAVPTLLLWGSRDSWISPRHIPWFAAHIPGIEVKVLDGLGHQPMLEDPATTAAAMQQFLAAHPD